MANTPGRSRVNLESCATFQDFVVKGLNKLGLTKKGFARDYGVTHTHLSPTNLALASQKAAFSVLQGLSTAGLEFAQEDVLEKFGYLTKKSIHPNNTPAHDHSLWISRLRAYLNITQQQFAEEVGLSAASIESYEQARKTPPVPVLRKIYDVHATKLFTGEAEFTFQELSDKIYGRMSDLETFGEVIKQARKNLSVTIARLCAETGVPEDSIEKLEEGHYLPSQKRSYALAMALRDAFPPYFTAEDALEKFDFVTKRSLHPTNHDHFDPGEWVYRVRKFHDVSKATFGKGCSRSDFSIAAYENGDLPVPDEVLAEIHASYIQPILVEGEPEYFTLAELLSRFRDEPKDLERFQPHLPMAFDLAKRATPARVGKDPYLAEDLLEAAQLGLLRASKAGRAISRSATEKRSAAQRLITMRLRDREPIFTTEAEDGVLTRVAETTQELRRELGRAPLPSEIAGAITQRLPQRYPRMPRRIHGK